MRCYRGVVLMGCLSFTVPAAMAMEVAAKELLSCAELTVPAQRLECFDRLVLGMKSQKAGTESSTNQAGNTAKEWFGLIKPVTEPADFGNPARNPSGSPITSLRARVTEAKLLRTGQLVVTLDNGQIWRQIEGDSNVVRYLEDDPVEKVTIEPGALGSFNMSIDGRPSDIKVRRIK